MDEILELANSPAMWIFAILIIAMAVMQSVVIYHMLKKYIRKTGILTDDEVYACLRTGGVVAIGPAISVFVVALSMISMIGSASTELTAASIGAEAAGVSLGMEPLTGQAFTTALWCCAVMSSGYLIFVPLVTRGVGRALNKVVIPEPGEKRSKLSWILSALLPLLIFLGLSAIQFTKSVPHAISLVIAALLMLGFNLTARRTGKKWLKEWAMAFSVLGGIVAGAVSNLIF